MIEGRGKTGKEGRKEVVEDTCNQKSMHHQRTALGHLSISELILCRLATRLNEKIIKCLKIAKAGS